MTSDYTGRLKKTDWEVRPVPLQTAQNLTRLYHYARGGANTATYSHGLFSRDAFWTNDCKGVAWWIPPTKGAAAASYPQDWRAVLCLSRLVIVPNTPKNAATFLLARSMRMIDRERWPCLITYADQWQGHTGTIYRAANWEYLGLTAPEVTWVLNGRLIARKAGGKTRTKAEMEALGAEMVGRFAKHKFRHIAKS